MRLYWIAHAFEWISMFSFLTFLVNKNVVRSAHMVPAIVLVVFENWSYGSRLFQRIHETNSEK